MNRTSISESKDRAVWEGWFKEAEKCKLDDGSFIVYVDGSVNLLTSERFINRTKTWDWVMLDENNKDVKEGDKK